jgi:hypothetical protein
MVKVPIGRMLWDSGEWPESSAKVKMRQEERDKKSCEKELNP